ncbi:Coiled-coil domain-containing 77 [Micractinium conductrix]|uniref:Coiled-coil domain-containing 77 n=1 Tax=Micractinium conductrix TaxID=554055 RepID=A0A2P6VG45_9CHLO|nr:Coiled-coil domain-containing 77 [Micractinium conductrix]|eukprot:PSC73064.1 Coiled-coil domain-containing 77 [Micractinium conductrix]
MQARQEAPGERGELVAYLQQRVAAADAERRELLERLEACTGPTPAQVYALQAENRKRTDEVRELQKALSDAHTYLFEERERLLALQADCDALRLQEVEDRARIKQLLSLTRPVEQRVVYGRDENGPQSSAVFHRGSSSGPSGARNSSGRSGSPGRAQRACCPGGGLPAVPPAPGPPAPERVLRTVYLPTAQSEALALKCEALTAQLAEQKRFAAERVAALTEDRAIRERDAATTAAALSATADQLSQRLRGAEEALRRTTRDYILARQQRDAAQAEAAAARDAAARERAAAADALEDAEQRAAEQLQQLRAELEADARASTEALQAELAARSEELLKFETLHRLLRGQLETRAGDAERRASRLAAANRELQQRRAHEMEGWAADVGALRKRIAAVDRKLTQQALLARLPDDERRDAVLARHARLASATSEPEYEIGLEEMLEELLSIKDGLLGMGDRVRRQAAPPGCSRDGDDGEGWQQG